MRALVVGASGATGRRLVSLLIQQGHHVRAIVRSRETVLEPVGDARLCTVHASLLDLSEAELAEQVRDCDAVVSCLGHTPSLKGIYGPPRRLVTEATQRLCKAIRDNPDARPVKLVLMNSAGTGNADRDEKRSFAERCIVGALRRLLPPYLDNEAAADCLRRAASRHGDGIEWAVVRPVSLTDADSVSGYAVHASPTASPFFDAAKVSRINVAHFIRALITDEATWLRWRGEMPVIYNE